MSFMYDHCATVVVLLLKLGGNEVCISIDN